MNNMMLAGAVVAPLLIGAGVAGTYMVANSAEEAVPPGHARVVSVVPVNETVQIPVSREECWQQPVQETYYRKTESEGWKLASTAAGAVVGVAIGNQIGSGSGRDVARVGGAIVGGKVGHDIYKDTHKPEKVTRTVEKTRCKTVTDYRSEEQTAGYDVTYEYQDEVFTTRMEGRPEGEFIRVTPQPSQG